jgi:hypothetical protein
VIEQPSQFPQDHPVPAGGFIKIQYSVTSPIAGSFALQEYNWIGYDTFTTNASFGYSEPAAQQALNFLGTPPQALLLLENQGNLLRLQVLGTTGCTYVVQCTTNLRDWTSVVTNISPFVEVQTNTFGPTPRLYRAAWVP